GAVGGGPRRAAGTGVALARPGGPRRRRRLGVGRLAGLALRPLLLVPVVVRPAPGAVGRRRAVAGGTAARHRTPATRRLVTPLPGRPGRPGAPVGTVRADTHAARGSGDGDQRGGQADGYVQAAHGATSDGSTGSTSPTPAARKRTRARGTSDLSVAEGVQPGVVDPEVVRDLVHHRDLRLGDHVVPGLAHPQRRPPVDGDPVGQHTGVPLAALGERGALVETEQL